MLIANSANAKALPVDAATRAAMDLIDEASLRETVEAIAIPRHYQLEPEANRQVSEWIETRFVSSASALTTTHMARVSRTFILCQLSCIGEWPSLIRHQR